MMDALKEKNNEVEVSKAEINEKDALIEKLRKDIETLTGSNCPEAIKEELTSEFCFTYFPPLRSRESLALGWLGRFVRAGIPELSGSVSMEEVPSNGLWPSELRNF